MDEKLHFLITDENGDSKRLKVSKKSIRLSAICCFFILTALITGCFFSTKHTTDNMLMRRKIASLEAQITEDNKIRQALESQIVTLNKNNAKYVEDIKIRHDLETTTLKLENIKLMTTAVSELKERSELIEKVMGNVGVKLIKEKKQPEKNSGGPFIPQKSTSYDDLLEKADDYLKTIRSIPLGKPISGHITSRYGRRVDPINGKKAFHTGIDLKGKKGEKVYCTASGVVKKAFYNGGYGNYVKIDHENGYCTVYAHLQNFVVKKGDRVEQGQLIGQVGNTGRSTGSHLHYEVLISNKTVNPLKFMKIADTSHTLYSYTEN